jgi:hypothetical protein
MGGSRSGSASPKGPSRGQTKSGACRSEGLVASEHVPDGLGEPAGDVDLGDPGAALLAEPALGGLVAVGVGGVPERVHGRFEHRPAQVARALFGQRAAAVFVAGLVHARAQAGVAAQLLRCREPVDVADLGADGERKHPPDPGHGEQQRDIRVVGAAEAELAVDEVDLGVEVVDQRQARLDGAAPTARGSRGGPAARGRRRRTDPKQGTGARS